MKINKQVIKKSLVAYLVVFLISIIVMKFYAGGGRGRLEGHYQMSWNTLLSSIHYLIIVDLLICYPFFYVFYRDYKKQNTKHIKSNNFSNINIVKTTDKETKLINIAEHIPKNKDKTNTEEIK